MKTAIFYKKFCFLLIFICLVSIPIITFGQSLVPCDGPDCTFCDIFVMFNNLVNFVLFQIVPPIAVLALVSGGLIFYFSTGDPKKIETAKALIKSTIFGVFIVYFAWSIVILVFTAAGAAQWDGWWYNVSC
jgi:hypothetical protein